MKIKKKGTSGNAKNFITRTQAVKKLQVSLADFRRLCIFKGIYPREPRNKKKANKGSTAPVTFYYAKDIQYLLHEPVLYKFRAHKTFAKKLQRALGRGEVNDAQKLEKHRPKYTLDHIIRERYPTFLDSLRDLDDPLNMLFLFSSMPATDKVSHRVTKEAEKLCNQWLAFVARERLVRKVFVSIKGVYYEAQVRGQEVRWLVPFKFPALIPSDVDFRIMLTFLEFYSTLLHFVLYKLYNDAGLAYPPPVEQSKLKGAGGLSSYILKERNALVSTKEEHNDEEGQHLSRDELDKALKVDQAENADYVDDEEEENDDELDKFESTNKESGDILLQPSKFSSPTANLFDGLVIYIGREVSLDILEFCILSCGGTVVSEIALDDLRLNNPEEYNKLDFSNVTHQVVDRPKVTSKIAGRTYIQPQWVFDSINQGKLISVMIYQPGEALPPHLSPWGDRAGYDPEANKKVEGEEGVNEEEEQLDEDVGEEFEQESDDENDDEIDEVEDDVDEDSKAQRELALEAAGVKSSDVSSGLSKKKKRKLTEEEEEKELKKIMMTNKQRKLYKKIQYGKDKKQQREDELNKKRKMLEKTKKQIKKL